MSGTECGWCVVCSHDSSHWHSRSLPLSLLSLLTDRQINRDRQAGVAQRRMDVVEWVGSGSVVDRDSTHRCLWVVV